ncbi:NSUN2 [Symbiodinium sp. CCMP2592]|nr:NSUN2 [Symbiodinium sp. CCMP2592]
MAAFVPQKPSMPPPSSKSPRRRMSATPPASQQSSTRSKPSAADLVEFRDCVTSHSVSPSVSTMSDTMSDVQESRVHFEETPEIILFLSADEGSAEELPVVAEEDQRGQAVEIGETPSAVPAGHDACEGGGGLANLAAERRDAMLRKLFPGTESARLIRPQHPVDWVE